MKDESSHVKQSKPANRKRPVTRKSESSTESPLTLDQVREAVEMAWTDALRLPEQPHHSTLCRYLQNAAECLDKMIARRAGR